MRTFTKSYLEDFAWTGREEEEEEEEAEAETAVERAGGAVGREEGASGSATEAEAAASEPASGTVNVIAVFVSVVMADEEDGWMDGEALHWRQSEQSVRRRAKRGTCRNETQTNMAKQHIRETRSQRCIGRARSAGGEEEEEGRSKQERTESGVRRKKEKSKAAGRDLPFQRE